MYTISCKRHIYEEFFCKMATSLDIGAFVHFFLHKLSFRLPLVVSGKSALFFRKSFQFVRFWKKNKFEILRISTFSPKNSFSVTLILVIDNVQCTIRTRWQRMRVAVNDFFGEKIEILKFPILFFYRNLTNWKLLRKKRADFPETTRGSRKLNLCMKKLTNRWLVAILQNNSSHKDDTRMGNL